MWSANPVFLLLRAVGFLTGYLLVTGYALRYGGRPEREAAVVMAAGLFLTLVDLAFVAHRFHGPEYGVAVIDSFMLMAFVRLMLTADRFWPVWLAAMQAIIVFSHLAMIFKPATWPEYYKNTIQLWSYPQVTILAIGTLRHRLRTQPSRLERRLGVAARRAADLWHERPDPQRRNTASKNKSRVRDAGDRSGGSL